MWMDLLLILAAVVPLLAEGARVRRHLRFLAGVSDGGSILPLIPLQAMPEGLPRQLQGP
jgi:hypothetical protein